MGKLADRLKEVIERPVRPIGFRAGAAQAKPPALVLLANIDGGQKEEAARAVHEGAQGVLAAVGTATADETLAELATAAGGGLWGGALEAGGRADVERLREAGAHFVLFRSTGVSGEGLEAEEIDKILEVEQNWPDMLLRPVDRLPVAAALYRLQEGEALSIQALLQCRRIVALVGKPLLVSLPPGIGTSALTLLRDAGVMGVVVSASAVAEFHAAIRDLPPPKRDHERMDAVLPRGGPAPLQEADDDDEEEDE